MKKNFILIVISIILIACGAQNNVSFSTTPGTCYDNTVNAPYCISVTIQNNNGGQNYITSSNFPFSNLTLNITGPNNILYPTSPGSTMDPNNCLGSTINPGASCTFFLQLSGESSAIGTKPPVIITANYTINSQLFGTSSTSASGSVTVYELPNVLISGSTGWVESYNTNGFSATYRGESSEATVNAVANDNYYGFLYLAGNSGLYYSGYGNYTGNATAGSTSITGVGNIIINGQSMYTTQPSSITNPGLFNASLTKESYVWTSLTTMASVQNNVSTANGSNLFFAAKGSPNIYLCNNNSSSGTSCNQEGIAVPTSIGPTGQSIFALAYTILSTTSSGVPLTGLVAGSYQGLWLESGLSVGSPANGWIQAPLATGGSISNPIYSIVADSSSNLYIADWSNHYYLLTQGTSSAIEITGWENYGMIAPLTGMVVDNAGGHMYISDNGGVLYACELPSSSIAASSAECSLVGTSAFTGTNLSGSVVGLNIVTAFSQD